MLLVFVLARKRRLDLVTVRAVAERRPPERSAVKGKTRSLLPVFFFITVDEVTRELRDEDHRVHCGPSFW